MAENRIKPPTLDLSVDRYAAFQAWNEKWQDYVMLTGLAEKAPEYQAAMLRYTFSEETRMIYESLSLKEEEKKDAQQILEKMKSFSKGIVNETMERHTFNNREQHEDELFDDYLTDLRMLMKNCNFCENCIDGLLRDRIVNGIRDDVVRKTLLSEKKLTLEATIEKCRAQEKAIQGMETMRKAKNQDEEEEINAVHFRNNSGEKQQRGINKGKRDYISRCKFCARSHMFGRDFCPAWTKECRACGKLNHFSGSEVCKARDNRRSSKNGETVGALFLGGVGANNMQDNENQWIMEVPASRGSVKFKIDTGADVSVIGINELNKFDKRVVDLWKTDRTLMGADGRSLDCAGYFTTKFIWNSCVSVQKIYVCYKVSTPLLGRPAIESLGILQWKMPKNVSCATVKTKSPTDFISKFPTVFNGLGKISGEPVHIETEEGATPYHITAARRVPLPLLESYRKEIERMEKLGVIKRVDEPTEWCHPVVIAPKPNGKIRLCLDLTKLNKVTKREFYQLEAVNETLSKIGQECNVMSKLDANTGYWQLPLDKDSQKKATFITPFGRFCPTRAPFGLSSLPEIFNKRMDKIIEGIPGVAKSMDDFLVYGQTIEEHDARLERLLNRLAEHGVTLNREKCQFHQTQVTFLGHKISPQGIRPLQEKISALKNFPAPTNITELRRFIGMAQQMARFTPKLAETAAPLRDLLSTKNQWMWTEEHDRALENIKKIMSEPPILAHYEIHRPTKIRTDGSSLHGMSVIVYQQHETQWKPVDCASRFLTPAEKNYYPIELEMLAITWGVEKMRPYLQGLPEFFIQTDHKPLIPILNYKPLVEMSPRIQAMRLRLLRYKFTAEHIPGKDLKDADCFSRAPTELPTKEDEKWNKEISEHVCSVIQTMPATDARIKEIVKKTKQDPQLHQLIGYITKGWPLSIHDCTNVSDYWNMRNELTYINGLILKSSRIVIPQVMRSDLLHRLHEGHLGMEKCKPG